MMAAEAREVLLLTPRARRLPQPRATGALSGVNTGYA